MSSFIVLFNYKVIKIAYRIYQFLEVIVYDNICYVVERGIRFAALVNERV